LPPKWISNLNRERKKNFPIISNTKLKIVIMMLSKSLNVLTSQQSVIMILYTSLLLLANFGGEVSSFSPSALVATRAAAQHRQPTFIFSMPDDPYPSDYDADDLESTEKTVSVDIDENDAIIRDELKRELILLSSVTNRGACATTEESNLVVDLVTQCT
jgi:hypothetical protein